MLATVAHERFHRDGWVYEEKYDGWRMLAFKDGDQVRLVSRDGRDHTTRFNEVTGDIARLAPERLILDGRVCVFDEDLVSRQVKHPRYGRVVGMVRQVVVRARNGMMLTRWGHTEGKAVTRLPCLFLV